MAFDQKWLTSVFLNASNQYAEEPWVIITDEHLLPPNLQGIGKLIKVFTVAAA